MPKVEELFGKLFGSGLRVIGTVDLAPPKDVFHGPVEIEVDEQLNPDRHSQFNIATLVKPELSQILDQAAGDSTYGINIKKIKFTVAKRPYKAEETNRYASTDLDERSGVLTVYVGNVPEKQTLKEIGSSDVIKARERGEDEKKVALAMVATEVWNEIKAHLISAIPLPPESTWERVMKGARLAGPDNSIASNQQAVRSQLEKSLTNNLVDFRIKNSADDIDLQAALAKIEGSAEERNGTAQPPWVQS